MGVFAGPEIKEDGLVLALDAGNTQSYPGSGTTWTDLSSNGNNGTLVNGVGYDSANGGSLSFDGTNDYVSHQNVSDFNFGNGNFSIESFVYLTNYSSNYSGFYGATIAGKDSNPTREYAFTISGNSSSYSSIGFFLNPGSGNLTESISQSFTFNLNTWYYVAISRNSNILSLFVDGYVIKSQNTTSTISSTSVPLRIGSGGFAGYEYFFPGYISNVRIYKGKGLTAQEVQQNFNALRARFGI